MNRITGLFTGILFAVLILVCIWLYWKTVATSVENAFVHDYAFTFYDLKQRSAGGELSREDATEYIKSYYPAGTKLERNSIMSEVVERIRDEVIKEINR